MSEYLRGFAIVIFLIMSTACERPERQYEDYDLQTSADLTLTADNHPHGYTKRECFTCHSPHNIHQVDTLGDPLFDSARGLVDQLGLKSCAGCHGDNGVSP